jgi:hypothetical protein
VIVRASTPQGWMMALEFCSSCMRMAPAWYASRAQMPDPPRRYDRSLICGTAYCAPAAYFCYQVWVRGREIPEPGEEPAPSLQHSTDVGHCEEPEVFLG